MHYLIIILVVMLCGSCAQLPGDVPDAPQKHAKAVVFDIDGTLTPSVLKFWTARSDAAKAVHIFADKGRKIIYLTARIRPLQSNIPTWLKENDFPDGSVYVTETAEDRKDHAQFKTRILRDFLAHGWEIEYAYGDSSTDFEAYAAVGIPKERVFALLREGDTDCQPGIWNSCLNGWTEYIDTIAKQALSVVKLRFPFFTCVSQLRYQLAFAASEHNLTDWISKVTNGQLRNNTFFLWQDGCGKVNEDEKISEQLLKIRAKNLPKRAAFTTEEEFHVVNRYFQPPSEEEGFNIKFYDQNT